MQTVCSAFCIYTHICLSAKWVKILFWYRVSWLAFPSFSTTSPSASHLIQSTAFLWARCELNLHREICATLVEMGTNCFLLWSLLIGGVKFSFSHIFSQFPFIKMKDLNLFSPDANPVTAMSNEEIRTLFTGIMQIVNDNKCYKLPVNSCRFTPRKVYIP